MAEFPLDVFTVSERIYIDTLANYSRSNLLLLFTTESAPIIPVIWQVAGRETRGEFCSACNDADDVVSAARMGLYDGILCRDLDKFGAETHRFLARVLMEMDPDQRGRVVFTASEFESIHPDLARLLAKMQLSFPTIEGKELKLYEDDESTRIDRRESITPGQRL